MRRALDDAGLELRDVDGLATTGLSRFSATQLGEYLGLQPVWTDSTMAGGSSFDLFVARAAEAIRDGLCEVAVVSYGSNQRSARSRRLEGVVEPGMPTNDFELPYAPLRPMSLYAMAARRHMHEFGTTSEQLAEIAVAARAWALLNPVAFMHGAGRSRSTTCSTRRCSARRSTASTAVSRPTGAAPSCSRRWSAREPCARGRSPCWGTARRARTWARCRSRT